MGEFEPSYTIFWTRYYVRTPPVRTSPPVIVNCCYHSGGITAHASTTPAVGFTTVVARQVLIANKILLLAMRGETVLL